MTANIDDLSLTELADASFVTGDYEDALTMYVHLLNKHPDNLYLWYATALTAGRLGDPQTARSSLLKVSGALAESGHMLLSLAAARGLAEHDEAAFRLLVKDIAAMYGAGSQMLGRRRRAIPPPMPEQLDMEDMDEDLEGLPRPALEPLQQMARDACDRASEAWQGRTRVDEPSVPFHPLLSDLKPHDLAALVPLMELRMLPKGEVAIQQGDEGTSFFMLVRGSVKVSRDSRDGTRHHLATMGRGAFFGEMALLTDSPRAASVTCLHPTTIFELGRRGLEGLANRNPNVGEVLGSYTRERLLRNLLATSPFFQPLDNERREKLSRLFHSEVFQDGDVVLAQGEQSDNLYVVLSGIVSVSQQEESGEVIQIADLTCGDLFGEISMIQRCPTTATVTAAGRSVVLYLTRGDFDANIAKFPEVLSHVYEMAIQRERENVKMQTGPVVPVDDSEVLV